MIRSYTYDVEVLKNFFSISIIEVNDYFKELIFMLWELDVKLKILN